VSPKWVPQMADTSRLFQVLNVEQSLTMSALTPNMHGFESAVSARVKEIAVIAAASETFSKKNINCTIAESLCKYRIVCEEALKRGKWRKFIT
jgi:hydroxymethylglutaryl-CoA lyase